MKKNIQYDFYDVLFLPTLLNQQALRTLSEPSNWKSGKIHLIKPCILDGMLFEDPRFKMIGSSRCNGPNMVLVSRLEMLLERSNKSIGCDNLLPLIWSCLFESCPIRSLSFEIILIFLGLVENLKVKGM